ncbi:UDP-3-O-(3-hydroxymyristoyl)glucosamine N-acyltransferase [Brevundimonas sp.]|uniref:UDP-3-O-(3-hydroxymyristoyl)glucosamine N-acyltransferase n=1 Tax=Brevundimonas sp. TaxID=1871086 RepID=UPI00391A3623
MPDARFFTTADPLSVADIAALTGAEVVRGGDAVVNTVAPLSKADRGAIAFLGDPKHAPALDTTTAGAVFTPAAMVERAPPHLAVLATRFPQAAWAMTAARLHPAIEADDSPGVHPTADLEDGVRVGPGVVIGAGVRVGRGTVIGANTVIGPGVVLGRDARIGANVSIAFALIGDRVRVASGAVIGEAGFGAAGSAKGPVDIPQLGRVIVQDDVSIGAGTCIDRGAYDDTVIGEGTKIDNLVHIAHNVVLGRFCLLAAHVGISGSVTVGDGVMFGGKAGVGDHQTIGAGARIAGAAAVLSDVPPGETWSGYPARPLRRFLRETVWLAKQAASRSKGTRDE